ncbi:hypothetical protein Srufu_007960 [Streptomyces libani subsp. rufus]|nr:hypothetical protein Srufu_007960 [Streptomyces libani subsp. rufus]
MQPQLNLVLFVNANDTSRHTSSANTSIYPNLGLLTLMSALRDRLGTDDVQLGYLDGVVHGNKTVEDFIDAHAHRLHAVCFSTLTSNYGASIAMARRAKSLNPDVLVILGNDHFSALYERIMQRRREVDFGFYGNDVVTGFADLHGRGSLPRWRHSSSAPVDGQAIPHDLHDQRHVIPRACDHDSPWGRRIRRCALGRP